MKFLSLIATFVVVPGYCLALDFNDYEAVCKITSDATEQADRAAFQKLCICAYGAIEGELGAELTAVYARFELRDDELANLLPEGMSEDEFFNKIDMTGPATGEACGHLLKN